MLKLAADEESVERKERGQREKNLFTSSQEPLQEEPQTVLDVWEPLRAHCGREEAAIDQLDDDVITSQSLLQGHDLSPLTPELV